ncbi:MAG TPA: allantoicase [Pyrinomonadaceae bacterium]|nr:allantoicase [Pyrinomonadaceae bacterium]
MDFTELVDLAAERVGGAVLYANDEFFAPKENLLTASAPVWREGEYTERGKWMDGWETRRRRTPGFDWCVLRLGLAGIIRGALVDTSFFRGNYPEQCSLEAAAVEGHPEVEQLIGEETRWTEILPPQRLEGDSQNLFPVAGGARHTHVRFKIYPDGGVARLRIYGEVVPDPARLRRPGEVDLAAVENGGLVVAASDMFFGHRHNLIMPGRALSMSDGWETKRRRGPGNDWAVVRLGAKGTVRRVEVDTSHFKGNFPESCSLEACDAGDARVTEKNAPALAWREVLPRTRLQAHARREFSETIKDVGAVTHVRLQIYPDGGVARLRVYSDAEGLES